MPFKYDKNISRKSAKRHAHKLKSIVRSFCALLDSTPKPDRETIRTEFIKAEKEWKMYCIKNSLGTLVSEYFNMKIAYEWETNYIQERPDTTPKQIQQ